MSKPTLFKNLILWQLILFFIFMIFLFPLVEKGTPLLVRHALKQRVYSFKEKLEHSASLTQMLAFLNVDESSTFFHTIVLNENIEPVFDNHPQLRQDDLQKMKPVFIKALHKGSSYQLFGKEDLQLIYIAERFVLQAHSYVLCIALPYDPFAEITADGKRALLVIVAATLLIFNLCIASTLKRLTYPIQELVGHIEKYQQTKLLQLPLITLHAKDPTGECHQLVRVFNALTSKIKEQVQSLRKEKEEKEMVLTSLEEGVIALSDDLQIEYANLAAEQLFEVDSLVGERLDKISQKPETLLSFLFEKGAALVRLCQHKEKRCRVHVEEKGRHFDLVATLKRKKAGAILVLQEKTEQYHILEMGTQFIANASHELRTPITIMKGYAETLRDMQEISPALFREIGEKIERSCVRMELLVKSLLTLASAENAVQSTFHDVVLQEVVNSAIDQITQAYPEVKIKEEIPQEPFHLMGHAELLILAITNLLENGLKYSDPPAKLGVKIEKKGTQVALTISDQGRGIPAQDLPHIFKRFYRVDKSHSRKLGGAGLGLSIVHTIVVKHRGKIEAFSEEGKGSRLIITLPLALSILA